MDGQGLKSKIQERIKANKDHPHFVTEKDANMWLDRFIVGNITKFDLD